MAVWRASMARRPRLCSALFLFAAALLLAPRPSFAVSAGVAQRMTLDGIIHADSDDTLAFTPSEDVVFFDRSEGPRKTIMMSSRVGGTWTPPRVAAFSGRWFDQDPVVAPDGSYLLFNSDRPVTPNGKPLTQNYFAGGPGPGSNIWRVDRKGAGWGKPRRLESIINNDVFVDFASIAADGTLYFIRWNAAEKAMHIWRSDYRHGRYRPPAPAQPGDPTISTHDPAVAPDQSFMVFDYGKTNGGLGRLCIACRDGAKWGAPIDLGDDINSELPWGAHVAPDSRSVYYTGQSGLWRLSLEPWLSSRRTAGADARRAN